MENKKEQILKDVNGEMVFEPTKGEKINVIYLAEWPSYKFIYGVPHKTNPKSKLEVGFFQYINNKSGAKWGFYVDCAELQELTNGFNRLLEISKVVNKKLWEKHLTTKKEVSVEMKRKTKK